MQALSNTSVLVVLFFLFSLLGDGTANDNSCPLINVVAGKHRINVGGKGILKVEIVQHGNFLENYVLTVTIPPGVEVDDVGPKILAKNVSESPTLIVWNLPLFYRNTVTVGLKYFVVDRCNSGRLDFQVSGYKLVNEMTAECQVQASTSIIVADSRRILTKCNSSSYSLFGPDNYYCIGGGAAANLPINTVGDCYLYCSVSGPSQVPFYFNFFPPSGTNPRCYCMGSTCILAPLVQYGRRKLQPGTSAGAYVGNVLGTLKPSQVGSQLEHSGRS